MHWPSCASAHSSRNGRERRHPSDPSTTSPRHGLESAALSVARLLAVCVRPRRRWVGSCASHSCLRGSQRRVDLLVCWGDCKSSPLNTTCATNCVVACLGGAVGVDRGRRRSLDVGPVRPCCDGILKSESMQLTRVAICPVLVVHLYLRRSRMCSLRVQLVVGAHT